ncbi:MAG: efflux RND transporter permease subunit, partial [Planctomycetota bacterium]
LALVSLFFAGRVTVDNTLEIWLMQGTPAYEDYQAFTGAFGSEEFVLASVTGPDLLTAEGLALLEEATRRASAVHGVRSALSPASVLNALGMMDSVGGRVIRAVPTYSKLLVSEDGETVGLLLGVDPHHAPRPQAVARLREELSFIEDAGFELRLGGPPVLREELNRLSIDNPLKLFPVVLGVTLVLLALLFRSVPGVLVPLAILLVTVLLCLAGINLAGRQMNMITVMFPALIWILGMSQAIHLLTAYGRKKASGLLGREAASAAVVEIAFPCLLMSLTTATGFLSLLFSDVGPVKEFGLYLAGGVVLSFIVNILLGPALLLVRGGEVRDPEKNARSDATSEGKYSAWVGRNRNRILGTAGLFILLCAVGAAFIEVETNALRFLREGHPMLEDFEFIQEELRGFSSFEIDVERSEGQPLSDVLTRIDRFAEDLEQRFPEVRVLSVNELLKAAVFHASTRAAIAKDLDAEALKQRAESTFAEAEPLVLAPLLPLLKTITDVSAYISDDADRFRISVIATPFGKTPDPELKPAAAELADRIFEGRYRITGIVPLMQAMQQYMISSQLRCMGVALIAILVFMIIAARSFSAGLVSMVPNLFPLLLNFGFMGLFAVRMDAGTMMVASLTLGIAVDNTIHMIVAFQALKRRDAGRKEALDRALQWKARPILYTTSVTCFGFMVLGFSDFLPMAWFGGLIALTVFWAMLGNLLVLPALLLVRDRSAGHAG